MRDRFIDLVFVILCIICFVHGVRATGHLDWPGDPDLFRDIAHAQTIADGDWLGDPHYRSETIWFNPLVPALVAFVSRLTDWPVYIVYTRLGAYVNLLAPICFYVMVVGYLGRRVALGGSIAFLFLGSATEASWASASYSPWLFSANLGQAFFLLTLVAYRRLLVAESLPWRVLIGVLWGLTFLAYTAPALILGGIFLFEAFRGAVRPPPGTTKWAAWLRASWPLAAMAATAFLIGTPYSRSILWNYHLRIRNVAPTIWVYAHLSLDGIGDFLLYQVLLLSPFTVVALVGLVGLWRGTAAAARHVFLVWLVICASYIAYSLLWQFVEAYGLRLPSIVPAYHFLFYLRLLSNILFGLGVVGLSRLIAQLVTGENSPRRQPLEAAAWVAGCALCFGIAYPVYPQKDDFLNSLAWSVSGDYQPTQVVQWIREHTQATDVFLAQDEIGIYIVGPAGRKIVAVDSQIFSNPYVDWPPRMHDKQRMFEYLRKGHLEAFQRLAERHAVSHVCVPVGRAREFELDACPLLVNAYEDDVLVVYHLLGSDEVIEPRE